MPGARKSSPAAPTRSDRLCLGRISGIFGLAGDVRLWLDNVDSEVLFVPRTVVLRSPRGDERTVQLRAWHGSGPRVLAHIEGVVGREQARSLLGWEIWLPWTDLPPAEEGSWYHVDLLGKPVSTEDGKSIGHLTEIHQSGSVDVWQVEGAGGCTFFPVLLKNVVEVTAERIVVRACGLVSDVADSTVAKDLGHEPPGGGDAV